MFQPSRDLPQLVLIHFVSGPAARLLRSWVRIPPGAWIFVCCECRVLSGRGLCDELITRPGESYRLCCVVVCDLETSRIGAPYIYNVRLLRVNRAITRTEIAMASRSAKVCAPRSITLTKSVLVKVSSRALNADILPTVYIAILSVMTPANKDRGTFSLFLRHVQ